MKTKHVIQAIIFVALLGSLGFNYMLWKTKENIKTANNKIIEEHVIRSESMQYDLILKEEYILELNEENAKLRLQIDLRDQLIKDMKGEKFGASEFGTERDNQKIIHSELEGEIEWRLDDGSRVDLVFEVGNESGPGMYACEIDWADKWAEGVGQSIYYTVKLNEQIIDGARQSDGPLNVDDIRKLHRPLVILLAKGKDSGWERYRDRAELCERVVRGMQVWVFDAETKTWLDKED